jgi:hypothetical protein
MSTHFPTVLFQKELEKLHSVIHENVCVEFLKVYEMNLYFSFICVLHPLLLSSLLNLGEND